MIIIIVLTVNLLLTLPVKYNIKAWLITLPINYNITDYNKWSTTVRQYINYVKCLLFKISNFGINLYMLKVEAN